MFVFEYLDNRVQITLLLEQYYFLLQILEDFNKF